MKLGLCCTIITPEVKMLAQAALSRGFELEKIMDFQAVLKIPGTSQQKPDFDVLLQRSVSLSRSTYITYYFERMGVQVINSYNSSRICADKMFCSLELAKAGVPTPKTHIAFSPQAINDAVSEIGFPLVIKPVVGSWARMVHRINDQDALAMEIDAKEEMGNPWQKIYYLQEHINKPGRDIRAFVVGSEVVAAIYRYSTEKSGWVTNASKGAFLQPCPITQQLQELCLKAVSILDEGIYGVDIMESESGLVVHEINHTAEFKGCAGATGVDIAGKIIDYAICRAKR